ncbi:hypothetical protein N0Y54_02275 [Nostoc punctiforme UO1]|uniref:hypothetical protein n=1 Tax=Nostoc punctiforme TaxID=272131 RepID=UPI0030970844
MLNFSDRYSINRAETSCDRQTNQELIVKALIESLASCHFATFYTYCPHFVSSSNRIKDEAFVKLSTIT